MKTEKERKMQRPLSNAALNSYLTQGGVEPPSSHLRAFFSSPILSPWEIFPTLPLTQSPSPTTHHFHGFRCFGANNR